MRQRICVDKRMRLPPCVSVTKLECIVKDSFRVADHPFAIGPMRYERPQMHMVTWVPTEPYCGGVRIGECADFRFINPSQNIRGRLLRALGGGSPIAAGL